MDNKTGRDMTTPYKPTLFLKNIVIEKGYGLFSLFCSCPKVVKGDG